MVRHLLHIHGNEEKKTAGFNRKFVRKLERERTDAGKDEPGYVTKMKNPGNVVEFDNLSSCFFSKAGTVRAVDALSFDIPKNSTVGLVGESGCGKSVTALSLMQLLKKPAGQIVGGEIRFSRGDGTAYNIVNTPSSVMETIRGRYMSMIFQEPLEALNPFYRVGEQIDEAVRLHNREMSAPAVRARSLTLLDMVGIADREGVYSMYPHELSGGMRERVLIAIALSCNPELLIADEPTASLDVTTQAQILLLLEKLKKRNGLSVLLITHDLGVVASMADWVVVMYAGRIVEKGTADDIFHRPSHPYTIGLLKSRPAVGKKEERLYSIPGEVPDPVNLPDCCYFRKRCEMQCRECPGAYPPSVRLSDTHRVSCYRFHDGSSVIGL